MKNDSIFVRKRKRNEEIRNTQMLRHPGINPWNDFVLSAVRTIPVSAGAEPELQVAAMRAHASNPSRKRSAAGKNIADRMEDRFGYAVCAEECGTMVADDVCETGHASVGQIVGQLLDEFSVSSAAHLGIVNVVGGSSQVFVTKDVLNRLGIGFQLNEVRGTAMPKNMRSNALVFDRMFGADTLVQRLCFADRNEFGTEKDNIASGLADLAEGKQKFLMPMNLPASFEVSQHLCLDGDLPTGSTFAFDLEISVSTVDVMCREMGCLGIAETAGIHQLRHCSENRVFNQG